MTTFSYKKLWAIMAILLGVFLVIYGGIDDSPGAQLLGIVVFITGIVNAIKVRKPEK